jgi:hypothetical protein
LIYQTLKQLSEFGEKIDKDLKNRVEERVRELEEVVKTDDVTKIKSATASLQEEVVNIGKAMYSPQGNASGAQTATNDSSESAESKDDVIDTDFKDNK